MFDAKKLRAQQKARREWEATLPKESRSFKTATGIPIEPVYDASDLASWDGQRDLGLPGSFPFTRGATSLMYRQEPWMLGEYAGFADSEATNEYLKYLGEEGCTQGIYIALDLPTQIGYDSDDPRARGEVGKVGVAIDSLRDMETLFAGIGLDRLIPGSPVNHIAPWWLAMLLALMEKQGKPVQALRAVTSNDSLMDYYARGTGILPPKWGLKFSNDVTEYCVKHGLVGVESQSVCGYNQAEAGFNGYQEIALLLAAGVSYIDDLLKRDLEIDTIAPHFVAFVALNEELFEEAAKLRALRRAWARLLRERYGAQQSESLALKIRAMTAGSNLTSQQPLNNVIRVTIEALAGILGGVQRLECSAFDEALAIPTKESARLAMRTQQIIAHETGVASTVDPLGGSYYVEYLTDELERRAMEYFATIEHKGGLVATIESGWLGQELAKGAYERLAAYDSGQKAKVGVNVLQSDEAETVAVKEFDQLAEDRQIERLRKLRTERDNVALKAALEQLEVAVASEANIIPPMIAAVKAYATVGEIYGTLRGVCGEWRGSR